MAELTGLTEIVLDGTLGGLADATLEALGVLVASLGTAWVFVGVPTLASSSTGGSTVSGAPPNAAAVETVLGYVQYIGLAVAVIALLWLAIALVVRLQRGEGAMALGRMGLVLVGVILLSGSAALGAALMPAAPANVAGAARFVQSAVWWYVGAALVVSIVIAAIRVFWEQRAEPLKDLLRSVIMLTVAAGAGATIISLLVSAADSFSVWILSEALSCDAAADTACFGENVALLIAGGITTGGLGALLAIVMGGVAMLSSILQIVLLVVRGGLLVVLTGVLPLAAAFTNTRMGMQWFQRIVGWVGALILYKPIAAIIYAVAFQLVGTDVFGGDADALLEVLTGLVMMVLALVAMPVLLRLVAPSTAAIAAGGMSGAAVAGTLMQLPSGAAGFGRGFGGADGASGPQGATGAPASGGAGGAGSPGAAGAQGAAGGAAQQAGAAGAGASGAGAAAGGSAAAGGAATAGSAAAGAASGGTTLAVQAVAEGARMTGQAIQSGANAAASTADGAAGAPTDETGEQQ